MKPLLFVRIAVVETCGVGTDSLRLNYKFQLGVALPVVLRMTFVCTYNFLKDGGDAIC